MDDTISRQAAIDAIRASTSKYTGFMEMEMYTDDDAVEAIEGLPSAQPYTDEEIQKIQDLEQAQFYKIHDLAYQEGKADAMRWISCTDRLPEYGEAVLTINDDEDYEVNHIIDEDTGEWFYEGAIAWMPLPLYKEG